jgi:hypothetical protein
MPSSAYGDCHKAYGSSPASCRFEARASAMHHIAKRSEYEVPRTCDSDGTGVAGVRRRTSETEKCVARTFVMGPFPVLLPRWEGVSVIWF